MTTAPKLGSLVDGRLHVTRGRTVCRESAGGGVEPLGRLPPPSDPRDRLATARVGGRAVAALVGAFPTGNVWPAADGGLVATTARALCHSHDGGRTWARRRRLPPSGTAGALASACCVADGRTYLGEYPLDGTTPRILASDDGGRRWTVLARLPGVRHVHAIRRDPYSGDVWVTTGDRDAACSIGRLVDGTVEPVGGGDQAWRAVDLAFAPSAVLWGVDSAYADTNRLYRLDRDVIADGDGRQPRPAAVGAVDASVYYAAAATVDGRRYVACSTAVETTPDRTAPAGATGTGGDVARVVAASSATGFTEWVELARYRKRRVPADHLPVESANAYVFLAASDDRGLFVNPYNTRRHAGTVRRLPPATLAARVDGNGNGNGNGDG